MSEVEKKAQAKAELLEIGAEPNQDFHSLKSDQVQKVLDLAKKAKYSQPQNANGSKARYYYARLQRLAHSEQSKETDKPESTWPADEPPLGGWPIKPSPRRRIYPTPHK